MASLKRARPSSTRPVRSRREDRRTEDSLAIADQVWGSYAPAMAGTGKLELLTSCWPAPVASPNA